MYADLIVRLEAAAATSRACGQLTSAALFTEALTALRNTGAAAARYNFLQNLSPELAQAYFWRFDSRKRRSEAIDRDMAAARVPA